MISKEILNLKKDLSKSVEGLISKELEFSLSASPSSFLLQSNLLIKLAKVIKKSPKTIFRELDLNLDMWSLFEENGILYINPTNPFSINLDYNFNREFKNIVYVPTRETSLVELSRIKAQILIFLILREALGLSSKVYFPSNTGEYEIFNNFKEFSPAPVMKIDSSNNCLNKIELDDSFIVLAFEENTSDLFKLCIIKNAALSIVPKIYSGDVFQKSEEELILNSLKEKPLESSFYLSKRIASQDLDCFVINANEQENILAFIRNIYQILTSLEVNKLEFDEALNLAPNDLEFQIKLKYIKVVLSFSECIENANIIFLLDSVDDLLKSFQLFFNTPELRHKISKNELNAVQFHLITSIFGLLKLCNTYH